MPVASSGRDPGRRQVKKPLPPGARERPLNLEGGLGKKPLPPGREAGQRMCDFAIIWVIARPQIVVRAIRVQSAGVAWPGFRTVHNGALCRR